MRGADFYSIENHRPEENGVYEWDAPFGRVKVRYDHGEWFLCSNGDRLPDHVVTRWR